MELVPLRGMFASSCALGMLAAWPHPAAPEPPVVVAPPTAENWRPRCEAMLDAARRDIELSYGVHFERRVHRVDARDPDELVFPSRNGMGLTIELAPNQGQAGADLPGPLHGVRLNGIAIASQEHGFGVDIDEECEGPGFVRIELVSQPGDQALRLPIMERLQFAWLACIHP